MAGIEFRFQTVSGMNDSESVMLFIIYKNFKWVSAWKYRIYVSEECVTGIRTQ